MPAVQCVADKVYSNIKKDPCQGVTGVPIVECVPHERHVLFILLLAVFLSYQYCTSALVAILPYLYKQAL